MKFAVLAALLGFTTAEHEMEDMNMNQDMCEILVQMFDDDMCEDSTPDGTMSFGVPSDSCIPFDMMRDVLHVDIDNLAKRAVERGTPEVIYPKTV